MIRPQYHFRQSPDGLLAWNVARLIRASRALQIQAVPIRAIAELDEPFWGSGPFSVRAVAEHAALIAAVDMSCPIILCAEGRVMDGMHRVARGFSEKQKTIPARRFPETPAPDFVGIASEDLSYDPADFEI